MSKFSTVSYSVKNRVATITLNRPDSLNAFNLELRQELLQAILTAESDDDVRVIILTGAGRGFSAGADIVQGFADDQTIEEQILDEYKPFIMAIHRSEKLVISAINGPCAGIGVGVALASDLAVMADDSFLYLAFAAIALVPDGGATWHLANLLGYKRALELIVEGAKIKASDCLEYGLVNRVVPASQLLDDTQLWAEKLSEGAPLAQKQTKRILQRVLLADLEEAIGIEAKAQNETMASDDHKNGLQAFFDKTTVQFTGK